MQRYAPRTKGRCSVKLEFVAVMGLEDPNKRRSKIKIIIIILEKNTFTKGVDQWMKIGCDNLKQSGFGDGQNEFFFVESMFWCLEDTHGHVSNHKKMWTKMAISSFLHFGWNIVRSHHLDLLVCNPPIQKVTILKIQG